MNTSLFGLQFRHGRKSRANFMAERRTYGFKMSRSVVVMLCCTAIVVTLMVLVVAGYLVDTYGHTSILVAVLASLIVAVTVAIPYWQAQRMCARKAQRLAAQQK
jgi:fucose 4-O-acetylase-like acetyltransferase